MSIFSPLRYQRETQLIQTGVDFAKQSPNIFRHSASEIFRLGFSADIGKVFKKASSGNLPCHRPKSKSPGEIHRAFKSQTKLHSHGAIHCMLAYVNTA